MRLSPLFIAGRVSGRRSGFGALAGGAADVAGGGFACTPGSFMPGGGKAGPGAAVWACTAAANSAVDSKVATTTGTAGIFMAATSMGRAA